MPTTTNTNGEPLTVVSPQEWREMCFSLPAVRSLIAQQGKVSILCPDRQKAFWDATGVESVDCYTEKASPRAIAKEIRGTKRALVWEPGTAAEACFRAGVDEIIGLPAPKLVKFLTKKLERKVAPGPPEHQVQRMLETARLMGADPLEKSYFLPIEASIERDPEMLLVVPESDFGANHEWDLKNWIKVIDWLKEQGREILIGQLRPNGLSEQAAEETGRGSLNLDLTDPYSYARFPQCLSADGSLPHLAGAFGAVCGVLFGPGDPALSRPLGQRHHIIRQKAECSPCFLDKCPLDLRCQHELTVDRVIEKLQLLNSA